MVLCPVLLLLPDSSSETAADNLYKYLSSLYRQLQAAENRSFPEYILPSAYCSLHTDPRQKTLHKHFLRQYTVLLSDGLSLCMDMVFPHYPNSVPSDLPESEVCLLRFAMHFQ